LNALTRDEAFARDFVRRHRDKLVFGSDCSCHEGGGATCLGAQIVAAIRRLAADRQTERKLLHDNARALFRVNDQ
jgi:predicted TIM-barrel fold metal-dependent hydrolase